MLCSVTDGFFGHLCTLWLLCLSSAAPRSLPPPTALSRGHREGLSDPSLQRSTPETSGRMSHIHTGQLERTVEARGRGVMVWNNTAALVPSEQPDSVVRDRVE